MKDHFLKKKIRVISEPTNYETSDNHEKRKQSNVTTKFEKKLTRLLIV